MPFLKLPIAFQPKTQITNIRNGQPGLQIDNHKVLLRFRPHYRNCRRQADPHVENEDVMAPSILMHQPAGQPGQPQPPQRFRLFRATAVESGRALPRTFWHLFDFGDDALGVDDGNNPRQRVLGLAFEGQRFTDALRNADPPDARLIAMYEAFVRHELIQLSVELSLNGAAPSDDVTPLFLQL